jgi:hypothetical protein
VPAAPEKAAPGKESEDELREKVEEERKRKEEQMHMKQERLEEERKRKEERMHTKHPRAHWEITRTYCDQLGVITAAGRHIKRWRRPWKNLGFSEWLAEDEWERDHVQHLVRSAIFMGNTNVALYGITQTSLVIVDVDVHGSCPTRRVRGLRERRKQSKMRDALHVRRWRAEQARPVIEALLGTEQQATSIQRTARGFHVIWKLEKPVPVAVAHGIGRWLTTGLPQVPGVVVEVFPKVSSDGTGQLCALPFLGAQREVEADLVTPTFFRRREAVEHFLCNPGCTLEEFGFEPEEPPPSSPPPESTRRPAEKTETSSSALVFVQPDITACEASADGPLLRGEAFAIESRHIAEQGLGAGLHYDEMRRVAAAFAYVSPDQKIWRERFERWLVRTQHGSKHANHDRRHVMREFDAYAKYFMRGVAAERCWFDGMRSDWFRDLMAQLDEEIYARAA